MRDDDKYLNEHHSLTETAIGVARIHLQEGNPGKAKSTLDCCCERLDEITIKYQPATARALNLMEDSPKAIQQ